MRRRAFNLSEELFVEQNGIGEGVLYFLQILIRLKLLLQPRDIQIFHF